MIDIIIQCGALSNIFVNTAKDCLSLEIFPYIPCASSNFCLKNAKRKYFYKVVKQHELIGVE